MLVEQRKNWRNDFKAGKIPILYTSHKKRASKNILVEQLCDYIDFGIEPTCVGFHLYMSYRNTNSKRLSTIMEQLIEYALFVNNQCDI